VAAWLAYGRRGSLDVTIDEVLPGLFGGGFGAALSDDALNGSISAFGELDRSAFIVGPGIAAIGGQFAISGLGSPGLPLFLIQNPGIGRILAPGLGRHP